MYERRELGEEKAINLYKNVIKLLNSSSESHRENMYVVGVEKLWVGLGVARGTVEEISQKEKNETKEMSYGKYGQ